MRYNVLSVIYMFFIACSSFFKSRYTFRCIHHLEILPIMTGVESKSLRTHLPCSEKLPYGGDASNLNNGNKVICTYLLTALYVFSSSLFLIDLRVTGALLFFSELVWNIASPFFIASLSAAGLPKSGNVFVVI